MDDPNRIILDISSDEEAVWGESGVTWNGGGRDDGDWISELLDEVEKKTDDPDEVLVVDEVIANSKQRDARSSTKCADNEEEDDDCVVLDGDPDKPVAIENDGGEDSDDLCLVGEKGQVACRDYPHPRHLCVKFPFSSTPHERHCDQCHCYVCDSVAPCVHWSSGVSSIGHCHATEKDEFWKAQRKGSKTSYKDPQLVSRVGLTPTNQVPSLPYIPLMHNQELPAHQPCSVTSSGAPDIVMPVRTQESGYDLTNKFQPHLLPHCLRRRNVGHAGTRFIYQCLPFKRSRMVGGEMTTNRFGNSSSRNNCGYQFSENQSPRSRWQDTAARGTPMLGTYQGSHHSNLSGVASHSVPNSSTRSLICNGLGNCAPSQPQISSQMHSSCGNANSVVPHPQVSSHKCMGSNFENSMPTVPGVTTQQRWSSPLLPLQPQAAYQLNVGRTCENVVPSQLLVTSHDNIIYSCESPVHAVADVSLQLNSNNALQNPLSYQPQIYGQPPPVPCDVQIGLIQGSQTQSALCSSSANVSFNQDSPTSQNSQSLPVECAELQSAIFREKSTIAINSQLLPSSNPDPVDFQFNTWSLGDESALEDLDIPLWPGFNIFSPEPAPPIDAGFLFDL